MKPTGNRRVQRVQRCYEGISKAAFNAWTSNFQILNTIKNESSGNIYQDYCRERVTELHAPSLSLYSSFPGAQKRPHGDAHTVCADQTSSLRHHTVNTTNPVINKACRWCSMVTAQQCITFRKYNVTHGNNMQ